MENERLSGCPFAANGGGTMESTNAEYLRDHMFINQLAPAPNMRRMTPVAEHRSDGKRFLPWFWPDSELAASVSLRREAYRSSRNVLQTSDQDSVALWRAASCLLALQSKYLVDHYPDVYETSELEIINKTTGDVFPLRPAVEDIHPLAVSGLLGQEDICIVEELQDGRHIMAAGFVASPTDWHLPDFIGLDMDRTHARVDGYHKRLKATIDRSLSTLPAFPERQFARNNIFLEQNPSLAIFPDNKPALDPHMITDPGEEIFVRSERETLTRLPDEHQRFIVFTIKPHVYRLSTARDIRGAELATAIRSNVVLGKNAALATTALAYLDSEA